MVGVRRVPGANVKLERQACEIRLRAERRAGQLLAEMDRAKAGQPRKERSDDTTILQPPKLGDLGVSKDQSSQWQKLAKVPDDEFEEAVRTCLSRFNLQRHGLAEG